MSFLYPRTVVVTRPNSLTGFGAQPYSGLLSSNETQILPPVSVLSGGLSMFGFFFWGGQAVSSSTISASIQNRRKSRGVGEVTPSDAGDSGWSIFIPASQAQLGLITERDIVTDDLGKRYQVAAAWWDSLGYQLICTLLQA